MDRFGGGVLLSLTQIISLNLKTLKWEQWGLLTLKKYHQNDLSFCNRIAYHGGILVSLENSFKNSYHDYNLYSFEWIKNGLASAKNIQNRQLYIIVMNSFIC